MKTISIKHVLHLHKILIKKSGGLHGVKNLDLLESALAQSDMTFGGEYLYKNIYEKIAAVCYSLATNHPMNDGNKRIAVAVMLLLCKENGIGILYNQNELIDLGFKLGRNEVGRVYIADWIKSHKE